jgi:hypothetical protein
MMTDQTDATGREARERAAGVAQSWTRRAVLGIVADTGGPMTTRPAGSTMTDTDAMTGLRTAADVELRARQLARRYIRTAREGGATWHEIGAALGLAAGDDHESIAAAAYDYAAPADGHYARTYGQSFNWRCPSCGGLVRDRGPYDGNPANTEERHGAGCARLAADVAAYDAAWGDE